MKKFYAIILFCMISFLAFSAEVIIDNCDTALYTAVPPPTTQTGGVTETLGITSNTASKTEGAAALDLSYGYAVTATAYVTMYADSATFAAPVDVSSMEFFKYDLKVPAADTRFELHFYLYDEKGYVARYRDTESFSIARTSFETRTLKLSNFEKSQWANGGKFINMKKITKIRYGIYRAALTDAAGTFNFSIDNVRLLNGTSSLQETVIEDFEGYADNAALQAAYAGAFGKTITPTISTSAYLGTKCMTYTADIAQWTNSGVIKTLSTPIDISGYDYFKMHIYGDAKLATYTPTAHIYFEDAVGNRIMAYIWNWPEAAEWQTIYMPIKRFDGIAAWTSSSTATFASGWQQDRFDAGSWNGADCDLTNITKIILALEIQGAGTVPGVTIMFDDILGGVTTLDPPTPPVESVKKYNVNAVSSIANVPAINGSVGAGEWTDAATPACSGFVRHDANTTAATEDVSVKAMFDSNYLYILLQTTDNSFSLDFVPTGTGRDPVGTLFTGDDFEFFLSPGGNNVTNNYHTVFFPYSGNGTCYVWDEFTDGGKDSWNATGDTAAFSYNSGTKLLTIEYKIPFNSFNMTGAVATDTPASGTVWGCQIGMINNTPAEAVNWEPDATAGFAAGRPFGSWTFTGTPYKSLAAKNWSMYE